MFKFFKRWFPGRDEVSKPKSAVTQAVAMLRREYEGKPFNENNVDPNPVSQFATWFEVAVKAIKFDPNAMILSTVDPNGQPSSRTVLLKGFDKEGFIFYTNYRSRKAKHIEQNPNVSLTFYWPDLVRQIHIEGVAKKISAEQSDQYFASRPDSSKLSAWASDQSHPISSRKELENRLKTIEKKFSGGTIPRPPHWGGFCVAPHRIEFWQGRLNRLHDRIAYQKENGKWKMERLSP